MNIKEYITEEKIKKSDLILIRGVPGSGKSTYAKKNFKGYKNFEADSFHMKDGKYVWKQENQSKAHKTCFNNTERELGLGNKVVVSNTLTTLKELNKYLNLAKSMNKTVSVIRMTTQFKNTHNVPNKTIERMKKRFQDFTGEVKV